MAKVLLRRAQQISNRIRKESAFEIESPDEDYPYRRRMKKTRTLNPVTTISIDGEPIRRVESQREVLLTRLHQKLKLTEIGSRIRAEMAVKQAQCGVSELVTERVGLLNNEKMLEFLLDATEKGVLDTIELRARVQTMRDRLTNSTQNVVTAEISTTLLNDQDQKDLQGLLNDTKRALIDIDDRLAKLNATEEIEINEQDEGYLRDLGIA